MQIPILSGVYADSDGDFRTSYPRNLVPVMKPTGISDGYLRPSEGITAWGSTAPGVDRGGIRWENQCYRVMGTKLVRIDEGGSHVEIGDVGIGTTVAFDYSNTHLAVASNSRLYLYDGFTFAEVTAPALGSVKDFIFIDGHFMATNGTSVIVTEIGDPFSVLGDKFTGTGFDPDPIVALIKLRNEAHVLNRNTIEVFDNAGSAGFPFVRIDGASIQRGCIGTHACTVFMEQIAFIGGGRNESPGIWLGASGLTRKLSTREIDQLLETYSEAELETATLHARVDKSHQHLWVQLPNETLVYDGTGSAVAGQPIWYKLSTALTGQARYRASHPVWCYDKWLVGDPSLARHGYLDESVMTHWGIPVGWEFDTPIVYNNARGAVFHELELVSHSAKIASGVEPTLWTSYSADGETFSQEWPIFAGKIGDQVKRLVWFGQGVMRHWRIQRFRGDDKARLSIAALEAQLEPLGA